MKKYIILMFGIFLMTPSIYSQTVQTWTETFDGNVTTFTASSATDWAPNSLCYVPGSSGGSPKSYHGIVPNIPGSSTYLVSPIYDCSGYTHVILQFSHICKVSPMDVARIEYRIDGTSTWDSLPSADYLGKATNYKTTGFNAASYSEWKANDSTEFPTQSWWKEETFDLTADLHSLRIQFRFLIKRGQVDGTQVSYGWLIDNFQLTASTYEIKPPQVNFMSPYVRDTVYGTGPWEINAKVKTGTKARIETPWLVYTFSYSGISNTDSVLMTNVGGDSLWRATIPKFQAGTTVTYSILGRDTTGNQASALSSYVIKAGTESAVTIGTGTTTNPYTPVGTYEQIAWVRMLFTGSELNTSVTGGYISSIEWQVASGSGTLNNQKCWIEIVNGTTNTLATGYINPVPIATEVFSGTITFSPGWNKVSFSKTIYLPPGMNLQIHWENKHVTAISNLNFLHHTATNTAVDAHCNCTDFTTLPGTLISDRPNTRFNFLSTIYDNSVALSSIELKDTLSVTAASQISIPVTIKNKGNVNLTLATVNYSVNGGTIQTYPWSGNLPWDFDAQATIGNYQPKINGRDTIKVWVSLPNNATDSLTVDDTLTKIIYGSGDILMSFIDYPEDTVYTTGPFAISARIRTISGAAIGTVTLNVDTTCVGNPVPFILPMTFDAASNLWKTTIPQTRFGSDVNYSISLIDYLGNVITETGSFFIKRREGSGGTAGYVTIGNLATSDALTPIHNYEYSWSRQIYYGSEFSAGEAGGIITELYWACTQGNGTLNDQFCYMRAVDAVEITSNTWIDPVSDGATLVWSGSIPYNAGQWTGITLTTPFTLPSGKNLMVYWHNQSNNYDYSRNWLHTQYPGKNMVAYGYGYINGWSSAIGNTNNLRSERADATFYFTEAKTDVQNSVALETIESPLTSGIVGVADPVRVRIKNTGIKNLDSCTVGWSLNGAFQSSVTYYGDLSEEFTDTITIGSITPQMGQRDTLVVWVSMPNGVVDEIIKDDTLKLISLGCSGNLIGTKTVGIGGDFASIADALAEIRECSLIGDLTLQLKGTYTENVDLTNLTDNMRGHILTITSLDNDPDSAIINPASGVGITIGNSRNIVIEKITIDREALTAPHAIQFTASCTNIVIRECKLLVNSILTTTYGDHGYTAPIHRPGNQQINCDSIFIIKNLLKGGHAGIFFDENESASIPYSNNIVVEHNDFISNHGHAVLGRRTAFRSISYNYIETRPSFSTGQTQHVFYLHAANADTIVGNQLRGVGQRVIFFDIHSFNQNFTTNKAYIANNEAIYTGGSQEFIFIDCNNAYADVLHNSLYANITGAQGRGFNYGSNPGSMYVRNNNIVITATSGSMFGGTSVAGNANYDFDYNNFYHSINSQLTYHSTMQNVVSFIPDYVDISVNTDVKTNNTNLYAPLLPAVTEDIEGKTRIGQATMGAYQIVMLADNLALNGFINWNPEVVKGYTVPVTVEIQNAGTDNVQSAVLGWSVNGQIQPSFTWTPATPLLFSRTQNVNIGTFPVDTVSVYNITVWVDSVNSVTDMFNANDTIRTLTNRMPLVEWANPVGDTVNTLSFDLYAKIRVDRGALITTIPRIMIETIVNGAYHLHDSVGMTPDNGLWKATVPQQYYDGKVIYSLTVSDTAGNTETIVDSTFIQFSVPFTPYTGRNLSVTSVINPMNNVNELCTPDYSPLRIAVTNLGREDYNFSQSTIRLSAEVINPFGLRDTSVLTVNTGSLLSTETDTFEVIPSIEIRYPGIYHIKAWVTSSVDNVIYDDTLVYEFISGRISLPIDEDFSGATMPIQFVTRSVIGSEAWEPYTDTSGKILPPEGNGMLRYVGAQGTITQLSTRQLDLFGAVDPKMEFWYYHDTTTSILDNSYTEVRVITDGVIHVERMLYRKKGTTHGWELYTVDLKPYTSAQCVLIQFESMNKYGAEAAQYIGHVFITSTPDLAVSKIIITPEATVCDLTNKEVRVVLSAMLSQEINFNRTPTNLAVRIGSQQLPPYTLQNIISGNTSDTILIATGVDLREITDIVAYITSPVDGNALNDSTKIVLDFQPSLSVTVNRVTNMNSRINMGVPVWQEVVIENTGNVELSGIELVLRITGTYQDIVRETLPVTLASKEIYKHQFVNSYLVPADERYQVSVIAYLGCDSVHVNAGDAIDEYVDMHNLSVISIDAPPAGQPDTIGTAVNITVSVRNTDDLNPFEGVTVYAVIESEKGDPLINRMGIIAEVLPSETKQFTFGETYVVPEDSIYRIRVYIDKVDNYQGNDTIKIIRQTVKRPEVSVKGIDNANVFTLSQNIPNPANNHTRIDYSIPEAGEVVFNVHSISGQRLYSKTIQAVNGKQSLELNTDAFAAGIYFYSIEYKGQRLVKRMMISD